MYTGPTKYFEVTSHNPSSCAAHSAALASKFARTHARPPQRLRESPRRHLHGCEAQTVPVTCETSSERRRLHAVRSLGNEACDPRCRTTARV